MFSFAFYSCDKDHDLGKDQDRGGERVYFIFQPTVLHYRKSRKELKKERQRFGDLKRGMVECLLTLYYLVSSPFYKSQDHLPSGGTSHSEPSPSISTLIKKIPYVVTNKWYDGSVFSAEAPSSQTCVQLTRTNLLRYL